MTAVIINFPPREEQEWEEVIQQLRARGTSQDAAEWLVTDFRARIERISKIPLQFAYNTAMTPEEVGRAVQTTVTAAMEAALSEVLKLELELYSALHPSAG